MKLFGLNITFGNPPHAEDAVLAAKPKDPEGLGNRSIPADPMGDWYLGLPDKLPPRQVSSILRYSLAGNLWQQSQLVQRMRDSWPEFRKCEFELRSSIANADFVVEPFCAPNQEPTESAKEKADLVQRALDSFRPDRFEEEEGQRGMIYDITEAIINGVSILELIWDENGKDPEGRREKQIRSTAWVHPLHYQFGANGSVGVAQPNGATADNPLQFWSNARNLPVLNNPSKFIVAKMKSKSGSCLGAGFARVLCPIWVAVVYGWDFMLSFSQKYGNPFLDIAYHAGISQAEIDRFEALAKQAQNQGYCVHPNSGDIKTTPPMPLGSGSAHVELRRMADEFCQKVLLGQTLTGSTPVNGGTRAQGEVHADKESERKEGLLYWVASILTEQLSTSLLVENYGDSSECPKVLPDLTRPLSVPEQVELMGAVSNCTLPLPKKDIYKRLALPMPEPGDEVLIRGVPAILEKALTETDRKEKDFETQVNQRLEVAKIQQEMSGGEPVQGAVPIRMKLAKATPLELENLENLVTAAERAPHPNGELTALKTALDRLGGTR